MNCPNCSASDARLVERIPLADIERSFRRQHSMEVASEFGAHSEISRLRCPHCSLEFFDPPCPGSEDFYSRLATSDTYYVTDRWEFEFAQEFIGDGDEVLDVGCGDGDFLSMTRGARKVGLEFNETAAERAIARGLEVSRTGLESVPDSSFDVVTLFQVIEHLESPVELGKQAARVLRPGGRFIVGAPDNDGMVGSTIHEPLNGPPHHTLRWNASSLEAYALQIGLAPEVVRREPLPAEHLYHYRRAKWARRLSGWLPGDAPLYRLTPVAVFLRRVSHVLALMEQKVGGARVPEGATGHSVVLIAKKANPEVSSKKECGLVWRRSARRRLARRQRTRSRR